jgi:DNA-binding transcriptional LysR family regulator
MFEKLFAESGLSLDRLRALLEVGAAGSIVKAAAGDPVRQSQYSRQINELEAFFKTRLTERQGKSTRLTANGRELARISRFFLLGLSNFQRGCLNSQQTFRIGAGAAVIARFLLPQLAQSLVSKSRVAYVTERVGDDEVERRLHDLTLDFGVVSKPTLSRPLQVKQLGEWTLELWVPEKMGLHAAKAHQSFEQGRLPLAIAKETPNFQELFDRHGSCLVCDSFLDVQTAMQTSALAGVVPGFLAPERASEFVRVPTDTLGNGVLAYHLAWNPRLLRLNPHAVRQRDYLLRTLTERMNSQSPAHR